SKPGNNFAIAALSELPNAAFLFCETSTSSIVGCDSLESVTLGCTYTGRTHNNPPASGTICRSPNTTSVPSMLSRLSCCETLDSVFMVLETVNGPSSCDVTSYATNVP